MGNPEILNYRDSSYRITRILTYHFYALKET